MRKLTIRELQNIEIDILKVFVKFCEANKLTYMLAGGTLLGAVRHKGFIPWDDDIDVLMPRPDFERLLNNNNLDYSALGKEIEILHWKNGTSNFPFIKVVKNGTKTVPDTKYLRDCAEVGKIWIDVFSLDGNPGDRKICQRWFRKVARYRKALILKMAKIGEGKTWYAKIFKPFVIIPLQIVPASFLCQKIDTLSKKYDYEEAEYAGCVMWGYGICESMKKEKYLANEMVEFEGDLYHAPKDIMIIYVIYMVIICNFRHRKRGEFIRWKHMWRIRWKRC